MLVLNHNGTVYMAYAGEESDVKLKDNCPMWHAGKHKKTLLGVFGSERLADVLRYEKIVSGPISKNNLVLTTVPVVRAMKRALPTTFAPLPPKRASASCATICTTLPFSNRQARAEKASLP